MNEKSLAERTLDRLEREWKELIDSYLDNTYVDDPELLALAQQAIEASDVRESVSPEEWAENVMPSMSDDIEQWAREIAISAMQTTLDLEREELNDKLT